MKKILLALAALVVTSAVAFSLMWARVLSTPDLKLPNNYGSLSTDPDTEIEQYAVFSAVLEHSYVDGKANLLVFQSDTTRDESEERLAELAEVLRSLADQDTIDDFVLRNSRSESVRDLFTLSVKHTFVTPVEVKDYFGEGGGWWDAFYKDHPGSSGLIRLSRVGFNRAGDRAVVYVEHDCGSLCGTGKYFSLRKEGGTWMVIQESMRWIS